MSQRKLSILNTPKGSLGNRSNVYQDLAKENRDNELAKRRGLIHENINDVPAPIGRMQQENNYNQNQQELQQELQRQEEEHKNMQMFEYKENAKKHAQAAKLAAAREEEAEMDTPDTWVQNQINVQSKKRKQKSIEDVIKISAKYADDDKIKWLLIDETESKYYKVGRFISKYDLGLESLGLYLPREDYKTFYFYSNFLVFYEFKNAVFSDRDLIGKFFTREDERDESSNNQQLTKIDTTIMKKDLDIKKEYVRIAKQNMRSAIMRYLGINFVPDFTHEPYIKFYEQIVPMVQRNLENNPSYNGNIDNAIAQLPSLEDKVKQVKQKEGTEFNGDEFEKQYAEGAYMETIKQLLSPVVAAPVAAGPPPVIQTAASAPPPPASASAAAAPSSLSSNIFKFGNQALSSATNYGREALSSAANYGNAALSTGINWGIKQANLPIPQRPEGIQFQRPVPPPPTEHRVSNNLVAAEPIYTGLLGRDRPAGQDTWNSAKQEVARREDADAAANKKPLFYFGGPRFGGKRKSKRKQRRSRKQKKSRKQRR
jgi:hypothetical protein